MTKTSISRRGLLAAGPAAALAAPAIAQSGRTLRLASTWPRGLGGIGDSAERFCQTVTRLSGGALTVEHYAAGELLGPFDVHDATSAGDIDMYHSAEYYYQAKHRGLNFFTTVPMGLLAPEQLAWVNFGGGQQLWDELAAQFGIKAFACGSTGVQMGGWFAEPLTSIDDLEGLVMRMPGLGGQVLNALGAQSVVLSPPATVEALFLGDIDATEWVGPWNDLEFGFAKVLSAYLYPGFHEPGTVSSAGINLDLWQTMSEQERAVILTAAETENMLQTSAYTVNNGAALEQLTIEYGARPTRIPDDVFAALARASNEIVADVANDDDLAARIYQSFEAFRRDTMAADVAAAGDLLLSERVRLDTPYPGRDLF